MSDNAIPESTLNKIKIRQEEVKAFFQVPENIGFVITSKDYYLAREKTKQWFYQMIGNLFFYQTALEANQKSEIEVRAFYDNQISKALSKFKSSIVVETAGALTPEEKSTQFLVSRDDVVRKLIKIKSQTTSAKIMEIKLQEPKRITSYVSEADALLKRVHDEYVLAPLGDTPDIEEIAKRIKIDVMPQEIRKIAHSENWRAERASYLHQSLDLVPEEIKLVAMLRTVDVHKMLYNHIKILHRQHMQYYQTGRVLSLDGTSDLKFRPDPGAISALAETMRRIVDGSSSVNILINNQLKNTGLIGASEDLVSSEEKDSSLLTKKYVSQLIKMSPDEIEKEIENLSKLRALVDEKDDPIIDVQPEPA